MASGLAVGRIHWRGDLMKKKLPQCGLAARKNARRTAKAPSCGTAADLVSRADIRNFGHPAFSMELTSVEGNIYRPPAGYRLRQFEFGLRQGPTRGFLSCGRQLQHLFMNVLERIQYPDRAIDVPRSKSEVGRKPVFLGHAPCPFRNWRRSALSRRIDGQCSCSAADSSAGKQLSAARQPARRRVWKRRCADAGEFRRRSGAVEQWVSETCVPAQAPAAGGTSETLARKSPWGVFGALRGLPQGRAFVSGIFIDLGFRSHKAFGFFQRCRRYELSAS